MLIVIESKRFRELMAQLSAHRDYFEADGEYQKGFRDGGNIMVERIEKLVKDYWDEVTRSL